MLWIIFALLLIIAPVVLFASYSLFGGSLQIILIVALVVFGINLIQARRYF